MDKNIRLSGIAYESLVNGPGMRRVFFAQGCKHNCEECFNPDTHDFNGGEVRNMDELIADVYSNPIIKGVTFSGGDPIEQADKFAYLAKAFKEKNLGVWCYTGYLYEELLQQIDIKVGLRELLNNVDVIIDGKFMKNQQKDGLRFRGSYNQRFIDVKASLKAGEIITLNY